MGKAKRGGYFFITWIGDHDYHVHVYKDSRQVLKWDLEKNIALKGKLTKKLFKLIQSLQKEGRI